jgi:repressor LexA
MRHLGDDDYTDLTERQEQILDYVEKCIEDGLPPTRAEIAEHFGIQPNAVQHHLIALERKGRIQLLPGKNRGIKLVRP